jgi:hypothetical protein
MGQITFRIHASAPLNHRRSSRKHKTYTITHAGARKPDYYASFPQSTFGVSRPDFLVQRGSDTGAVIGEVRFRGMMKPTRIVLPGRTPGAFSESTAMTTDRMWSGRLKVAFMGKDWYWKSMGTERSKSFSGTADMTRGGWTCEDPKGNLYALFARVDGSDEVARLTISNGDLSAGEVEGLVVTALALFAEDEKRVGDESSDEWD